MKIIIKLYEGLVEWFKRLEREIAAEDVMTNGKFSSALIVICCLGAIVCFILAFMVFGG